MKSKLSFLQNWRETYWGFLLLFLGCFGLLYYFNLFYIGITAKGGLYSQFLDENLNYIEWWRTFCIQSTAAIIDLFGFKVYTNDTQLAVLGRSGFTLIYECLGYGVMSVFVAFVIAFPKHFKSKLLFLLIGVLLIQALNTLRFVLLALYWKQWRPILGIDHHDLFNVIIYLILMVLVYIWLNYFHKDERNTA